MGLRGAHRPAPSFALSLNPKPPGNRTVVAPPAGEQDHARRLEGQQDGDGAWTRPASGGRGRRGLPHRRRRLQLRGQAQQGLPAGPGQRQLGRAPEIAVEVAHNIQVLRLLEGLLLVLV